MINRNRAAASGPFRERTQIMAMQRHQTTPAPSRKERLISLTITGVLVIVALGVWLKQARFPAGSWRPVAASTESVQRQSVAAADAVCDQLAPFATKQVNRLGPPETFDAQTLSDKIDGKADLYLAAGFVALTTQRFQLRADASLWFEVFRFDMGTLAQAFSVYSQQKRAGAVPFPAVRYGYQAGNALFFVKSRYYVEMIGASASERLVALMRASARGFIQSVGAVSNELEPERLFPAQGLIAGSVTLLASNAFGFAQLDQVFIAQYRVGADEATGFVKRCASAAQATALARAYQRFLLQYGAVAMAQQEGEFPGGKAFRLFDGYELLFTVGEYLAGVHEGSAPGSSVALATLLKQKLVEMSR